MRSVQDRSEAPARGVRDGTDLDAACIAVNHEGVEKIENGVVECTYSVRLQIIVGRDGGVLRRRRALAVEPDAKDLHSSALERAVMRLVVERRVRGTRN